jgi:hypothetical protein
MSGGYNNMVILDTKFKKFLKFKQTEIKYDVILNYLLCNYFDNLYEDNDFTKNLTFILRQNFKSFLINNKLYCGDDYSRDGVKKLLENFITKKIVIIKI